MENQLFLFSILAILIFLIALVFRSKRQVYTYKGRKYILTNEYAKALKNPETRAWVDVVEYIQVENNKTYFREADEFFRLFKLEK